MLVCFLAKANPNRNYKEIVKIYQDLRFLIVILIYIYGSDIYIIKCIHNMYFLYTGATLCITHVFVSAALHILML